MPAMHEQTIHLHQGDRVTVEAARLHEDTDGGYVVLDVGGVRLVLHARGLHTLLWDLREVVDVVDELDDLERAIGRVAS